MDSDNTSIGRFEMGTREAIKREVKEEPVDGENYQPEQEQQQDEDEPTSDAKDQITIHDYFFSGGKQMLPSAIPNGPRRSRSKHQNFEIVKEHSEVRSSVMDKAEEIQANLDPQYPSFVKIMLHSHVTRGFWLGLPVAFCKMHMPKHNGICILVDEDGEEFKTRFLAAKMGISGGWTSFATAHKLLEGDAVVFHLIKTHKFEVHIVRGTTNGRESGEVRKEMDTRATSFVDFENFNIVVNNEVLDIQMSTSIKRKYYELCRAQNHTCMLVSLRPLKVHQLLKSSPI
ncbi:OLC1v1003005C1 [Oldenlandia corymbosa var. corymbosa]|uniref:OLC1v1003005C1 n=1 Tax=Oldenlandia corymbosa var. corymbosa TaxID=529605 RepID=A0AAV1DCF8_OLDCO|nr:OLC1v1003005C1 [Oldenlandia corymbosa var. corymbosa]